MSKRYHKIVLSWMLLLVSTLFSSCDKDDDASNTVTLKSFGPFTLRGGPVSFIGTNLNRVTAVVFPDGIEVTSFDTKSATLLQMNVPEEAVEGIIILKTPEGEIRTKTPLAILEPITIESVSPATVRPGEVITIEGTYLNLIEQVTFSNNKTVTSFESQSRTTLQVKVPEDAQSGIIALADGETVPNVIETETALQVKLPVVTGVSPTTVKAGGNITLSGTDLDLATEVLFGGGKKVASADFVSKTATEIVVKVPADAQKGKLELNTASLVKSLSPGDLLLVVSGITAITPSPAKTGGTITVTGTDLDLVDQVTFGGDKVGAIQSGGTATQITVKVPDDAQSGEVAFRTKNNETVNSSALPMVKPGITAIPASSPLDQDITITGTDLDIVKEIKFAGGTKVTVNAATATQVIVKVPLGTQTGSITLVANNGDEVVSPGVLTILAEVPLINSFPPVIKAGTLLTLTGTKLNLTNEVIFPGDIKATQFGNRTATSLEVMVPQSVPRGDGKIKITTYGTDVTESPDIEFVKLDAVADEDLVFFDFNKAGKDSWWDLIHDVNHPETFENNPAISLDGTLYGRYNGNLTNWNALFFRNSKNNFPADVIGTDVANYVLKFDINFFAPMTGGELSWRFKGDGTHDYSYAWKPWEGTGSYDTDGWITIAIPLTDFSGLTDMSIIDEDFGVAFNNGSSTMNFAIDNVRFEHK